MTKSKLAVSLTESFNIGRIEGQIELLRELNELLVSDSIDVKFVKAYIAARLKSIESLKGFNQINSNNP